MAWTARYRFRVSGCLASEETELAVRLGDRKASIISDGNKPLKESNWLTLQIHDLENEDVALAFGKRAALAILVAGVRRHIGIDAGEDRPSLFLGKVILDAFRDEGKKLLPAVHGLFVYKNEGNEVFISSSAEATITADPLMFLSEIESSLREVHNIGEREQTALALIALSKMAREPLAEAALCISAVEYISSDAPWTSGQVQLLTELKAQAAASTTLPQEQAKEVADGIERVFKSIRQSVKRKMAALGLTHADWKLFDDVYSLRSGILHGSITGRSQHMDLAVKARDICSRIIITAAVADPATASVTGREK